MGKSEVGSPKWVSKMMKMKGLQKLRWYCQACEKQCRDEHGFRLHTASPSHAANQKRANAQKLEFSNEFEAQFKRLLKRHHDRPVSANKVYNELIQDKQHVHMNATRFPSLTAFMKHLESVGVVRIHATTPELMVQYIDVNAALRKEKAVEEHSQRLKAEELAAERALSGAIASEQAELAAQNSEQSSLKSSPNSSPRTPPRNLSNSTPASGPVKRPKIAFSLKKT